MLVAIIICTGINSAAADDLKILQLEQDIRELTREVQQHTQRISILERELAQSRMNIVPPIDGIRLGDNSKIKSADASSKWLNIANWDRIRLGVSELEVIRVLGPPTTLRKSEGSDLRTLFYAMEIGTEGFLSGSVTLSGEKVIDVKKPKLL